MPFPTQFPQAAMEHLVQELLGGSSEPLAQLVEDAYDVLGYGLHLGFSGGPMALGRCSEQFVSVAGMSNEDKAEVLKHAVHPQATAIPWGEILAIVMSLLQKWLAG